MEKEAGSLWDKGYDQMTEIADKYSGSTNKHRKRVKLIFNPSAGASRALPIEIVDVIHEMQAWKLVPEAYLVLSGYKMSAA